MELFKVILKMKNPLNLSNEIFTNYSKGFIVSDKINIEGGWVDDPSDSGGETNKGITIKVAREAGYTGDMKNLSDQAAYDIYVELYWNKLHLDHVWAFCPLVADKLFDIAINCGTYKAGMFLQTFLNVMNNEGKYYGDIKVDGMVGQKTLAALAAYCGKRGKEGVLRLLITLCNMQGSWYVELAGRRVKDEKFVYGWSGRVYDDIVEYGKYL